MNNLMKAYIESFDTISIIMNKSIANYKKVFYLKMNDNNIKLTIKDCLDDFENFKYIIKYDFNIPLNKDIVIYDDDNNECNLFIGSIIRDPLFDEKYKYDGPLGFSYAKDKTVFRIWTPVAKEVTLVLNHNTRYPLTYIDKGLWEVTVLGDLELYSYYFLVRIFDYEAKVKDPYAIASSANNLDNYVIDLNKLYKKRYYPEYDDINTKAIIYEASIRDLTCKLTSIKKGTYLGVVESNPTESGLPTGLDYLSYLGITHLQLLPFYDFGGVDDLAKDDLYNWGYNPVEYMVPSGYYSIHPYDPYSRINELKLLVDEANKRNIKVIMDVVFNHVYNSKTFPFDSLVPGYYYRHYNGWGTNASGCGNDLASEKYMCRRFIIDCLKYYVKIFDVSGFRFDLMGILDVTTMNQVKLELFKLNPFIMIYGEGWDMDTHIAQKDKACRSNHRLMPNIGFFNDLYRDTLKGNHWSHTKGFAYGNTYDNNFMYNLIAGSSINNFFVSKPSETINYVECHDNYTFYDFGKYVFNVPNKLIKYYCLLGLQMVLISIGVPFIHAGQEFLRTKQGVENSYRSSDIINFIDYKRRDKYLKIVNAVKDLIALRKEYSSFSIDNPYEVKERILLDQNLTDPHHLVFKHIYEEFVLYVVIKNNLDIFNFNVESCTMIYDSRKKSNVRRKYFILKQIGVYIFRRPYANNRED